MYQAISGVTMAPADGVRSSDTILTWTDQEIQKQNRCASKIGNE
jgi:hypothetical protein